MKLIFHPQAWEDYQYWLKTDRKWLARLRVVIQQASRTPFAGIGKPEPLRGQLAGWWSLRISGEHRLIYRPSDAGLLIAHCRYHYI